MRAPGEAPAAPIQAQAPAAGASAVPPASAAPSEQSMSFAGSPPRFEPVPPPRFEPVQPPQPAPPEPFFAAPAPRVGPAEAAAPQPTVHIGSIEIIIESPAEPRTAPAPAGAAPDLSSRFYLRGL